MKTSSSTLFRVLKWIAVIVFLFGVSVCLGFAFSKIGIWNEQLDKRALFYSLTAVSFVSLLVIMRHAWVMEEYYWETTTDVAHNSRSLVVMLVVAFGLALCFTWQSNLSWYEKPVFFILVGIMLSCIGLLVLMILGGIARLTQSIWSRIFDWTRGYPLGPLPGFSSSA